MAAVSGVSISSISIAASEEEVHGRGGGGGAYMRLSNEFDGNGDGFIGNADDDDEMAKWAKALAKLKADHQSAVDVASLDDEGAAKFLQSVRTHAHHELPVRSIAARAHGKTGSSRAVCLAASHAHGSNITGLAADKDSEWVGERDIIEDLQVCRLYEFIYDIL